MKYLSLAVLVAVISSCGSSSDGRRNVGGDDSGLTHQEKLVVGSAVSAYHYDVNKFLERPCQVLNDPFGAFFSGAIGKRDAAQANKDMERFFGERMVFDEILAKGKDGWNYDVYKVTWVMEDHAYGRHSQTNLYHFNALDQIVDITEGVSFHERPNGYALNTEEYREWSGHLDWCAANY